MQLPTFYDKIKQTNIERYGVEFAIQNNIIIERRNQNNIEKYRFKNVFQVKEIKEKKKKTCLKNYGVEYPTQNKDIFEKALKSGCKLKRFKDTDLWYQGAYEEDFLDKNHDKFPDIVRGPRIIYLFEGKEHYYFPDFFIPSLNLIVEIKNSWLAKKDKKCIEAKKQAAITAGFNYIIIIGKDYSLFNI